MSPQQRTVSSFFKPRNQTVDGSKKNESLNVNPKSPIPPAKRPPTSLGGESAEKRPKRYDILQWTHEESSRSPLEGSDDEKSLKFRRKVFGTDRIGSSLTGEHLRRHRRGMATSGEDQYPETRQQQETSSNSIGHRRKLKPMEQQIVDLKKQHPDAIMLVEKGYKYNMYGDDARRVCGFMDYTYSPGWLSFESNQDTAEEDAAYDRFASWSFPSERISFYVKKLVYGGFKVAVVNQTEAAAVNAVENKGAKIINRKVTSIQTRGTFISASDVGGADASENGRAANYLMSIYSSTDKLSSGNIMRISIAAVDVSTGDLILDEFDDSSLLSEMETRLLHIQPCEILLVGVTSKLLRGLIDSYSRSGVSGVSDSKGSKLTIENIPLQEGSEARITQYVDDFFSGKASEASFKDRPTGTKCSLYGLISYLKEFMLAHVFDLASNREKSANPGDAPKFTFTGLQHMLLSGNTLASLEIFKNQTNHTDEGSLFSIMDHTRTSFGQRALRKWIAQPLIHKDQIEARQQAVEEIVANPLKIQPVLEIMRRLPDLEKDLATLYYKKISRKQLYWTLTKMRRVAQKVVEMVGVNSERKIFRSSLLKNIFSDIEPAFGPLDACLAEIDSRAAEDGVAEDYFKRGESLVMSQEVQDEYSHSYEEIASQKDYIMAMGLQFASYLDDIKAELKRPAWKFVTHQTTEYLIEIPNADIKAVPGNWIKNSGTKAVSRFDTTELIKLRKDLNYHKEKLIETCNTAFELFMDQILVHFEVLRKMIAALSSLDGLVSLATVSMQRGYVRPVFMDDKGSPTVNIVDGRHPVIEDLVSHYIPNDIKLGGDADPRVLLITGPNMGGKSSYVRQAALICIMAQVGAYVPAKSAKLGIIDAVYTRIGAYDNLMAGESTFMVELKECCDIMKRATSRSLVILDEIGRGTGTMDGAGIAYAVLSYFLNDIRSLTLFVTHYPLLGVMERQYPEAISNCLLGVAISDAGKVIFTYKLEHGVAPTSYGLNVAQLAGLPQEVLDLAAVKSHDLERQMTYARMLNLMGHLRQWVKNPPSTNIVDLLYDKLGDQLDTN